MSEPIETWLATLHKVHPEAEFVSLEPEDGEHSLLAGFWPVDGWIYGVTTFSNCSFGKPEFYFQIEVQNAEEAASWALAVLQFADDHRATADLVPGALFAGGEPLVDPYTLDGWVIGLAQAVPGLEEPCLQLFPIHRSEVEVFKAVGLSKFISRAGEAIYNSYRAPILLEG